ncbi:MAG: hypothetical protein C0601_12745 [Candidatus Muiribacterium halophilum]|uniref:SGNH/GDSL hydrolase family protein n=1 Tax=Muiribacterium halophilum TaxID=2053465 RepID=A0A2N5ZA22_MUIH1|nr:MAG: hypothetical protein C0601_12745 [Candidatus Muirbacterium halophilum]
MKKNIKNFLNLFFRFKEIMFLLIIELFKSTSFFIKNIKIFFVFNKFYFYLKEFQLFKDNKLLYLGDSVVERIAKDDKDRRTLGDIVKSNLEEKTVVFSNSAYNARVYYFLIKALKSCNFPEKILIPINLRSFSNQWFFQPLWIFEKEINFICEYIHEKKPTIKKVKKDFFSKVEGDYLGTQLRKNSQFEELIKNKQNLSDEEYKYRKKNIFIYHYMFNLDPDHILIKYLRNIIVFSQQHSIRLFFYFTPINFQAGNEFVGEIFDKEILKKVNLLKKILVTKNTVCFDYSTFLQKEFFFNEHTPTEHLNERGRERLANKIVEDLKEFY